MVDDVPKNLVDDFVNYIRNKYKKHFITEFESMVGIKTDETVGFNMFVEEDGTVIADRIYLKPESQKKGIGTEIMQEMFDWSNKNNQPFEFTLMAGYDDLSNPQKIVETQEAFQEKLKDITGLTAHPTEGGMLDTKITKYKYTPQLGTPTNVVDEGVITIDRFGRDVTIPVDEDGNVILYRATDDPHRILDSDFDSKGRSIGDTGTVGLGQQSYFSPNPMYSHKYQRMTYENYKYSTNIKLSEILPLDETISNRPKLARALNIPEEFWDSTYKFIIHDVEAILEMGYARGSKRLFQDNIDIFNNHGIKAFGTGETGSGGQPYIEYEIVPLVKDGDTLGIEATSILHTKEGFDAGKRPEAFIETPLDTPTNVVDDYQKKGNIENVQAGYGGRPLLIEDGIVIDGEGNPVKSFGKAEGKMKVYRVVPEGTELTINANDWVWINEGVANQALKNAIAHDGGEYKIIEMEVSQGDVYRTKDLHGGAGIQMGYYPKDTPPKGKGRPTSQRVPIDDDIPSVWKTIEYVDGYAEVKNSDNFWLESSETLFGEEFLKEEVEKHFIKTNEPFELDEGTAQYLRRNFDVKIEDNITTYQDLKDSGLLGDGMVDPEKFFQEKFGQGIYSINRDRLYFENPTNQDFIQNKFIPALESGNLNQLTDVEKSRLTTLIYRLQAYETSERFSKSDQKADIVKKVFMGDIPVAETGLNKRPSFVDEAGINQRVVDLLVDNQNTINRIVIVALKKHQNQFLPDSEYMLVFRAGDLGFHGGEKGLSSFSKSYRVSLQMLGHQGGPIDPFGLEKGGEIRAYLVPTKKIVDTEALGIRGGLYGNEKEVLAYDADAIPLDSSVKEGLGNIVERIVEGEELTDNDVLEAIERHEVRKTTTRAGVDLIDQEFSNYSERVRKVAQGYANVFEAADPVFDPITIFSDELGIKTADIFDALPQFDPEALPHYEQFIAETNAQYRALLDEGIVFELVDADPYTPNKQGHAQMMEDLDNGRFKVLATESGFGSGTTATGNPMLKTSKFVDVNGRLMLENDVFRAVHDSFGHGMRGNTFGSIGEYNAFLAHSELYSDYAIRAMATETLGQNTWTNYGPHMRDESGRLIPQGDPNYKKPSQRPFSDQKVALLTEEIITEAKSVAKTGENLITPEGFKAYSRVVNNAPEVANQIYNQSKKAVGKLLRGGLRGLQVFDPGDIVIEQGLIRALPRLGLAAISYPLLIAYVAYESTVLLADIGRAASIAFDKQEELLGPAGYSGGAGFYDKEKDYDWKKVGSDTWKEMGAISDTWSLSWRISEPIIDYVFSQEPVQEAVGAGMQTYATMRENR